MTKTNTHLIRKAQRADLAAIVELETRCFEQDRFSKRTLAHLVSNANGLCLVCESSTQKHLLAYSSVLYRKDSTIARLYAIAVHPDYQGQGIAKTILATAEQQALQHGCCSMRLEVRQDNKNAIGLYLKLGYLPFGCYPSYYSDQMSALRMEKNLKEQEAILIHGY